jgi:hypothetical protein
MDYFVVSLLHKELSSSGLTGRSSTPRLLDFIRAVSGILGRPVKPGDDDWECGALDRVRFARLSGTTWSMRSMINFVIER